MLSYFRRRGLRVMGFVLSLVIIFTLTVALSRVTARVRKLAQMIALQEDENEK